MSNILITSVGRRVSLVRAFKAELIKIYPKGKVFVTDYNPSLSAAAEVADQSFKISLVDENGYIDSLLKICLENKIRLIIPTIDNELQILSKNKIQFKSHGINIVVSDEQFINICENKLLTHQLFKSLNVDFAICYSKKDYELPLYIKPLKGSSSINNYLIKNQSQISNYHLENDSLHFFEYLDHELYDEYTCDLYYNKTGDLKCVIPRKRIETRGGEVSKGLTQKETIKKFVDENFTVLNGAQGCVTLQLFYNEKENIIKGIEVNARFGGGFPLAYLAGGNYPKWIIQEYLLNMEISYFDDWEDGLLMLRYDDEVLVYNYDE